MNAAQVNTLGGICELLGVLAVVWGLVDLARYRGVPARVRAWLDARRATIVATAQRLLRRPRRVVLAEVGTATEHETVTGMARGMRGPFTPQPGQSPEDQIAELGLLVNRLREELITQDREHRQAVDALRKQADDKLQAERARAEAAVTAVREELARLRETTTGGLRLQIDGVLGVVAGVIFTTWPGDIARWLPGWPPFRVAMFFLLAYVFARLSRAWLKSHEAKANASPGQQPGRGERAA
jgi:hypothetical protein